jgi:hypothetical protein
MWRLRQAYANMDFQEFHKTLHNPRNRIITDEFIAKYVAQGGFRRLSVVAAFAVQVHCTTESPSCPGGCEGNSQVLQVDSAGVLGSGSRL